MRSHYAQSGPPRFVLNARDHMHNLANQSYLNGMKLELVKSDSSKQYVHAVWSSAQAKYERLV